jgi:hypothetical protein
MRGFVVVSTKVCVRCLFPAKTDLRGFQPGWQSLNATILEIPQGTGRYYFVQAVDDVFRGFAVEYRQAVLQQSYVTFPIP